jgi:hypothetical protein
LDGDVAVTCMLAVHAFNVCMLARFLVTETQTLNVHHQT